MPSNVSLGLVAKHAVCLAIAALVDGGSGPGRVRVYDDGEGAGIPASCEAPPNGQQLCTITLAKPAFGDPVTGEIAAHPVALAPIGISGFPRYFRVTNSEAVVVMQGSAGESAGFNDFNLDDDELLLSGSVQMNSMTYFVYE